MVLWPAGKFKKFGVSRGNNYDVALSRLKQGFDSPRERHRINGLVGVCDAALWQWTTRWTSPSGIFTPKSVELISRCADPPQPPLDLKDCRGRISNSVNLSNGAPASRLNGLRPGSVDCVVSDAPAKTRAGDARPEKKGVPICIKGSL